MEFLTRNALLLVLIFSSLGLLLCLFRLWWQRRRKYRLEADSCGLWRYHKETQFKKKDSYGELVAKKKDSSDKDKDKGKDKEKDKDKEKKIIAVISFQGDLRAKQRIALANLVDEIEVNADDIEEVVVCVNSSGGMVAQYGHAFAQMERIRKLGLSLTVCIDAVAASGGYLMSIPAHKIIAAPFAMIGSIGVMAFVPNFRRFLTNMDINPRTFTAGRFKRTVTLTDEATPEEIERFQQQLETIHRLFSAAVGKYRSSINLEEVATGEHWTAMEILDRGLGLIDELGTSHEYLLQKNKDYNLVYLNQKRNFFDDSFIRITSLLGDQIEDRLHSWWFGAA